MSKFLVTGAGGFIGRHLCERLIKQGHGVIGVDNFTGSRPYNLNLICRPYPITRAYVDDRQMIDWIFSIHQPHYCIHAAAYAAECLSPFIRSYNYINNIVGTANIVTACIKYNVKRLDFLSSVAVYGKDKPYHLNKEETMTNPYAFFESDLPQPSDPYGNAKLASERDIQIAHDQHELDYRIWRMHNVFGVYQHIDDPFRNVIGIFIKHLLDGKPLPIFGDGKQIRQFTPVSYICDAICTDPGPTLEKNTKLEVSPHIPNGIYNVGSNQEYTIQEIADYLSTLWQMVNSSDKKPEYVYLDARHEASHPRCDHSKIQGYVGSCVYSIQEKLLEVLNWALNNPDSRFDSNLPPIELAKGLPASWSTFVK